MRSGKTFTRSLKHSTHDVRNEEKPISVFGGFFLCALPGGAEVNADVSTTAVQRHSQVTDLGPGLLQQAVSESRSASPLHAPGT